MNFKEAVILLTRDCNFDCYHCYVKKEKKEIPFSHLSFLIDKLFPKYKIQKITLIGGEPFLYKKLPLLLKRLAQRKDIEITITTNGSVYSESIVELLKLINLKLLKISLHSLDPIIFSKFTGTENQYKIVLKNIDNFSKFFNIGISTTVTRLNYKEIDKLVKFCKEKGIKFFQVNQLTPSGKGAKIKDQRLEESLIKEIKERLKKYSSNDLFIKYDECLICDFGQKLIIDVDGSIYPCAALVSYPKFKIGNIYSPKEELEKNLKMLNKQRTKRCFIEDAI
jgi:MoaA/NifB/PqqE/SkfB family radical SAM enzyme